MSTKSCPRCTTHNAEPGKKYCHVCEPQVKSEMKRSGYLQKLPGDGKFRPQDARENTNETKYGVDD